MEGPGKVTERNDRWPGGEGGTNKWRNPKMLSSARCHWRAWFGSLMVSRASCLRALSTFAFHARLPGSFALRLQNHS